MKGYPHNKEFYDDINRIGWGNFKHEIISSNLTEEDAYILEKELIHKFDSTNPEHGYNKAVGGKINYGMKRNDTYKRKMSESLRGSNHPMYGKHHSEESKQKMSKSTRGVNHPMYGKHLSEETKRKLSISHKREHLSEETLNKMRVARLGKHLSEETKRKIAKKQHTRKVLCVETNKVFNSIASAASYAGCYPTNITAVCRGRQPTAGKYHWVYVD